MLEGDTITSGPWPHHVIVADAIAREIRARDLVKVRGNGDGDPWRGHRDLVRLKVALVLAILERRVDIRPDDWELAGVVVDTSDAVRKHAQTVIAEAYGRRDIASAVRQADREIVKLGRIEDHVVERLARSITRHVLARPGELTPRAAKKTTAGRDRDHRDGALEYALERGWIEVRTEPGQGEERIRLWPGQIGMPR